MLRITICRLYETGIWGFLERLLKGKESMETVNEKLSNYNIKLVSDVFCVMTFYISDITNIFNKKKELR